MEKWQRAQPGGRDARHPRRAHPPLRPGTSGRGRAPPGTAPTQPRGAYVPDGRAMGLPEASVVRALDVVVSGLDRGDGRDGRHAVRTAGPTRVAWIAYGEGTACRAPTTRQSPAPATHRLAGTSAQRHRRLARSCAVTAPRRSSSRSRSQLVTRFQLARFWSTTPTKTLTRQGCVDRAQAMRINSGVNPESRVR